MSNNRAEIARKLAELKLEYESLDRFFYTNFKITHDNFTSYIKAKPYTCCEYSRRIDAIKRNISKIWILCNTHTGGWFDNYEKEKQDKRHIAILLQIESDTNKLISLYKSYEIKE